VGAHESPVFRIFPLSDLRSVLVTLERLNTSHIVVATSQNPDGLSAAFTLVHPYGSRSRGRIPCGKAVSRFLEPLLDPRANSAADTLASSHSGWFALSLGGLNIKKSLEESYLLTDTPCPPLPRKSKPARITMGITHWT